MKLSYLLFFVHFPAARFGRYNRERVGEKKSKYDTHYVIHTSENAGGQLGTPRRFTVYRLLR